MWGLDPALLPSLKSSFVPIDSWSLLNRQGWSLWRCCWRVWEKSALCRPGPASRGAEWGRAGDLSSQPGGGKAQSPQAPEMSNPWECAPAPLSSLQCSEEQKGGSREGGARRKSAVAESGGATLPFLRLSGWAQDRAILRFCTRTPGAGGGGVWGGVGVLSACLACSESRFVVGYLRLKPLQINWGPQDPSAEPRASCCLCPDASCSLAVSHQHLQLCLVSLLPVWLLAEVSLPSRVPLSPPPLPLPAVVSSGAEGREGAVSVPGGGVKGALSAEPAGGFLPQ